MRKLVVSLDDTSRCSSGEPSTRLRPMRPNRTPGSAPSRPSIHSTRKCSFLARTPQADPHELHHLFVDGAVAFYELTANKDAAVRLEAHDLMAAAIEEERALLWLS